MHDATVYQLHVTLAHSVPPVWRRLLVTGATPLHRLHQILQIAMAWDDTSPYLFEIDGTAYGEPFDEPHNALPDDLRDDLRDAYGMPLAALAAPGTGLVYRYDFAAGWELWIEVEALQAPEEQAFYPRCTGGALAAPPEWCAGIEGYHQLRTALDRPSDPLHGEAIIWLGEPFAAEALNAEFEDLADALGHDAPPPLPVYADAELATLDEAALIERLRRAGDRAPRNLIDACAARGAAMVQTLAALLDTDAFWGEADDEACWLAQHVAMIAGLIPGAAAGQLLVDLLEGICRNEDEVTEEWLAPWWPALFANKPPALAAPLRALVVARECNVYFRANVAAACVRLAAEAGAAELEDALDWLAALVADETQDWDCRLMLCQNLLDLPRARHRPLLEALAARQQGLGVAFTGQDVREAYDAGRDQPEWARFDDPWTFYRPENIVERQRRWASERYGFADDPEDDALWPDDGDAWPDAIDADDAWVQPYVRSEPKIGRNDPCPCGSGKKYKKCCLGKAG